MRVYKHNTLPSFVLFLTPLPPTSYHCFYPCPCWSSCSEIEAKENTAATLLHHTQLQTSFVKGLAVIVFVAVAVLAVIVAFALVVVVAFVVVTVDCLQS